MSKTVYMKGLQIFVADIRACQNKEQEKARVEKELAKIRSKFNEDKQLSGYDRRKYVWKLLYIYMLGYDIDFGHKQACDLIPAVKYSDKQVGYMACSLLLDEKDEFLRLSINAIRLDLVSRNEAFQCLALAFVSNIGGQEMAEALSQDVLKLLASGGTRPLVKKKAALCLLRMIRKAPQDAQIVHPDAFAPTIATILEERDLGVLLSTVTLLLGIVTRSGPGGYESSQPRLIRLLERLILGKDVPADYTYYAIPSPWLQCKILRTLQFFSPPEHASDKQLLLDLLQKCISVNSEAAKSPQSNKANAMHGILFEAVALALHLDAEPGLLKASVDALSRFMLSREPNTRYLALEYLGRLSLVPEVMVGIRGQQSAVVSSLRDPDISIRRRAMDLLFTICDTANATELVGELLKYLAVADFSMREELVLKIAILAEKFAPSVQWYVDVVLQLMESAGDFVGSEIWHRVVQLVANNEHMQQYAAHNIVQVLRRGSAAHESLLSTAAYILGEFGRLVRSEASPTELVGLLNEKWPLASPAARALIMTAYIKLLAQEPENAQLRAEVEGVLRRLASSGDADLQQRAIEYLAMSKALPSTGDTAAATVRGALAPMPNWPERESRLLRRLARQEGVTTPVGAPDGLIPSAGSNKPSDQPSTSSALTSQIQDQDPSKLQAHPSVASSATNNVPLESLVSFNSQPGTPPVTTAERNVLPSAAQPPATTGGTLDLLDLLATGPPPPAPPAPHDPFAASTAIPVPHHEEVRLFGDMQQWYMQLLVKERGILYEDTYLQIGLQSRYSRASGEVMLFLGNKHATQALSRLICNVPATPALQFAVAHVPNTILPKQQIQIQIGVLCLQPFLEPPRLQLSYALDMAQVNQEVKLPISNHKFMVPQPEIPKELFFDRWRTYTSPPQKLQEMVDRQTGLSPESVISLLRSVNFGVQHGHLDPSPHNEAGTAAFCCGMPETQMLCQVRIEGNPSTRMQFRVTVATPHPMLSTTLKDVLVQQVKTSM